MEGLQYDLQGELQDLTSEVEEGSHGENDEIDVDAVVFELYSIIGMVCREKAFIVKEKNDKTISS